MSQLIVDDDQFERWAAILLTVALALALLVGLILVSQVESPFRESVSGPIQLAATVGVIGAGIWGLVNRAPWARPFAVLLLVLMVVEGVATFLIALTHSSLNIPMLGIAAVVVLAQRHGPIVTDQLTDGDRSILTILGAITVMEWLWTLTVG